MEEYVPAPVGLYKLFTQQMEQNLKQDTINNNLTRAIIQLEDSLTKINRKIKDPPKEDSLKILHIEQVFDILIGIINQTQNL